MKEDTYVNQFEDVHKKVQAFKDRVRNANEKDAELRERRAAKDAADALGHDTKHLPES